MHIQSKMAKAVRLALAFSAASATAFVAPAIAAEEGAEEVERISVSGSRIKRSDMETASPVSVFDIADIEASGFTTLEDFVQSIPSINGAQTGSSVNNGNDGNATASLRGLGAGRTLILINGRRMVASGEGDVDLNNIPLSIIKRVEVVRDGASTIYGSDAIAGVINFITRDDFEGAEFTYQYDITGEGDGEVNKFSATLGTSTDRGHAVVALEYTNRGTIWQKDRSFSQAPLAEIDGVITPVGSSHTVPGRYNYGGKSYVLANGVETPYDGAQHSFNYAAVSYMVTPQEVLSLNLNADYDLIESQDISTVTAFVEGSFTNRKSDQLLAPVATFWGASMPTNNPANPTIGTDNPQTVTVNRRLTESGGRNFTQDVNFYRMVVGFQGDLFNDWAWDISYNYGRFVDSQIVTGQINQPRMNALLDKDLCDSECPGLWNPLIAGSLNQDMLDYATVVNSPVLRRTLGQFNANLTGDTGDIELPGGAIQWAVGYENRFENYLEQPDGAAALGQIYFVAPDRTAGSYRATEQYAEISMPILADVPMAHALRVDLAVRSSQYDFIEDSATNTKVGIEYSPIEDVMLRTVYAEGFRAPSINELFGARELSAQSYSDPCNNWDKSTNANIRANCAGEGLPEGYVNTNQQATSFIGGNPNLKPEESESITFGIVYNPSQLEDFSMTLDYFDISIESGIGTAGTDNVVSACYESSGFSSPLCSLMIGPAAVGESPSPNSQFRNDGSDISGIDLANQNLSTFETAGVDFDFDYSMEVGNGELDLGLEGTYLSKYDYVPFEGAETVEAAGYFAEDQWVSSPAAFSSWKANLSAGYSQDNWSVTWGTRFMSKVQDINAKPSNLENKIDRHFYHDINGTYSLENITFAAGVRNLADKKPPYVTSYDDMNTIQYSYDTAGRYFYGRVTAKF